MNSLIYPKTERDLTSLMATNDSIDYGWVKLNGEPQWIKVNRHKSGNIYIELEHEFNINDAVVDRVKAKGLSRDDVDIEAIVFNTKMNCESLLTCIGDIRADSMLASDSKVADVFGEVKKMSADMYKRLDYVYQAIDQLIDSYKEEE